MKREEIKTLISGITDEQLDKIMGWNGEDINREKGKATELQGKLDAANGQLQTAQEGLKAFEGVDVNALQGKIAELQGKLTEQASGFAFDGLLNSAITGAKGKSAKAIRALLDIDTLKASKNQEADVKAALESLKTESGFLFDAAETPPPYAAGTGTAAVGGTAITRESFGKMGYRERAALHREHPEEYEKMKEV